MKFLKAALLVAAIAALVLLNLALWQIRKTTMAADAQVQAIAKKALQTITDADRLIQIAGGAATEAQKASVEQRQFLKGIDSKVIADLDGLGAVELSAQVAMTKAGNVADAIRPVLGDADNALVGLQPIELQLTGAANGLNAFANNPEIAPTVTAIHQAAVSTQGATLAGEHSMQSVEKVAAHYEVKLDAKQRWYEKAWVATKDILMILYYASNIK